MGFFAQIFGSNEREIRKIRPIVARINDAESSYVAMSDDELRAQTSIFKERIEKGETFDNILPEAFATVREVARRVIGQRHFDVQLIGGVVLHRGAIAEMKTGEGKTLTSTLAVYLNALSGKGVHVVTVNDYLARRDCNWMGSVYHFLGISTACVVHDAAYLYEPKKLDADEVSIEADNLRSITRREAYAADVTYGTNNEFGFDYLRDNMVQRVEDMVQRPLYFAIVDEVDSILIDEARTPLIISAPDTQSTQLYGQFAEIVRRLKRDDDFTIDEKLKAVSITDDGISQVEKLLGFANLYDPSNMQHVHHLEQALKAQYIFQLDRDYVVRDNQVIIVDDFTGRLMPGRRYSEGLHQAIEAKEHVPVQKESRTLATITFQNYFRMYQKLSGMTGTASTSAEEFSKVYTLDAVEIPTNKQMVRMDHADIIYKTEQGKFRAIAKKVKEIHVKGQPVLVGTIAIEKSEYLSTLLSREGISHEVLNAKNHEREAMIVANAGRGGSVTIATNMAGRGTDIKLDEAGKKSGGLFILGTERHEARRIDNQLRGRSGRQGDPGESQFFVSLEDELMRRFGGDKLKNMMDKMGLPEDEPIQNGMISKMIESAQTKIEGFNFDIRKHVLEYDDVMNKQREVIYSRRKKILEYNDAKSSIMDLMSEEIEQILSARLSGEEDVWETAEIVDDIGVLFSPSEDCKKTLSLIQHDPALEKVEKKNKIHEYLFGMGKEIYNTKEMFVSELVMRQAEKFFLLRTMDMMWMNHLDEIDYLRQGIGLRGYGQRDPLVEYKREAYLMFSRLLDSVRHTVLVSLFHMETREQPIVESVIPKNVTYTGADDSGSFSDDGTNANLRKKSSASQPVYAEAKVGRNDLCPCGSGKKYKKCHGK